MPEHDGPTALEHNTDARETYMYDANTAVAAAQGGRTAAREAAFFLPHLRAGMSLLDAGCGGGSITVGLAEAITPGRAMALDLDVGRLSEAQTRAVDVGAALRLAAGDVYHLPFPDASFD